MNELIKEINGMLKNQSFEYAFCGGYAIDLFLEKQTRPHGDVDIMTYWKDRDAVIVYMQSLGYTVYEMIGDGKAHLISDISKQFKTKRNIACIKDNSTKAVLSKTEKQDIFYIDFPDIPQYKSDFVEFLFNDKNDTDFLYARNHEIRRVLDKAILFSDDIPYLSPELCLLYKSTDTERNGYQHDYDAAMAKMNDEQKAWLNKALALVYDGNHKWISDTI